MAGPVAYVEIRTSTAKLKLLEMVNVIMSKRLNSGSTCIQEKRSMVLAFSDSFLYYISLEGEPSLTIIDLKLSAF